MVAKEQCKVKMLWRAKMSGSDSGRLLAQACDSQMHDAMQIRSKDSALGCFRNIDWI